MFRERNELPASGLVRTHAIGRATAQDSSVQDKVVFVFNFGDYLRTIAPGTK